MAANTDVILGEISGAHGLQGWVKVHSFTRPREQIFEYDEWLLVHKKIRQTLKLSGGKPQGKTLVAKLVGVNSRNDADALIGASVVVSSDELKTLPDNEYYWRDLVGLNVVNEAGTLFGVVTEMLETGANDVMLVSAGNEAVGGSADRAIPDKAIPWLDHVVKRVDRKAGEIIVDWDEDF